MRSSKDGWSLIGRKGVSFWLQEELITYLFFSLKFCGKIETCRKRYSVFYSLLSSKKEKTTCKELELSRNRSARFSVFLIQGLIKKLGQQIALHFGEVT